MGKDILENSYNLIGLENTCLKETSKNPKVSIIVPAYNAEKIIGKCLLGIIKQSLEEIEIIVINNGSTDNTLPLVTTFADQDFRIKIVDLEKQNLNLNNIVSTGIYINSDKVLVIKADDILKEKELETLISPLKKLPDINYYEQFFQAK